MWRNAVSHLWDTCLLPLHPTPTRITWAPNGWEVCKTYDKSDGSEYVLFLDPEDRVVSAPHRNGKFWEDWMGDYMRQYSNQQAAAVDIGANIGSHALRLAKHFGIVYAFEPQTSVRFQLYANLLLNDIKNVQVYPCALSHERSWATLQLDRKNKGQSFIRSFGDDAVDAAAATDMETTSGEGSRQQERVRTETLDSILADRARSTGTGKPRIAFIKLDVEGHEESVLYGAVDTLSRDRPVLLFEMHHTNQAILRLLRDLGYHVQKINILTHDYLALPLRMTN